MQEFQKNNKRIAKNTLMLYVRMLLIMGVTLYTLRVVLNTLGVESYGVYNVVGGMVSMFAFLNTAFAQATQRFIVFGLGRDTVEQQRKTFSMLLNVHIIIALILLVLCETIGLWLFYNKLVIPADKMDSAFWVMQCSIVTLMFTVTQVPYNASIFGHERMSAYAYIGILEVALKLAAVLSLKYFLVDKLLAYGILMMSVGAVVAITYRGYCLKHFQNCHYVLCWSKTLFKEVSGYTSWSLIGNLAWTMNSQGMNILINMFFGPVFNAARGVASQVEAAVSSSLTNFLGSSIPQIIKLYAAGDIKGSIKLMHQSSKFGFLLFMTLSIPLISIINIVLKIWLVNPPQLSALFCLLSLVYVQCNSFGGTLQNLVQATGNVRLFQITSGSLKLGAVPVVYILYKMGCAVETYLWVIIAFSLSGLLVQLLVVRRQIEEFHIRDFFYKVINPEIRAYLIPLFVAVYFWQEQYSFFFSLVICVGLIIICIMSAWWIGITKHERIWITNIIRNKIRKNHGK